MTKKKHDIDPYVEPIESTLDPIPDTIPPPADNHGFLEQFETLSASNLSDLKKIVELGLRPAERMMLIKVSIKLLTLSMHEAKEEELTPEMRDELDSLILELTSLPLNT